MKTKFFRKNNGKQGTESGIKSLSPFSFLRSPHVAHLSCLLVLLTATFCAVAQNGVTLSGLVMDTGTVTFNVSWKNTGMPAIWSDTVWVWVDYNIAGTMTRLPLSAGATLTATSAPGVGKVMEVSGNNSGVWVLGNARSASAGSFSATVKLLTATATATGACVYASNYPPVGQYTSVTDISFRGTRPYDLVLKHTDGNTTVTQVAGGSYSIPAGYTLQSFTDKTGAPGVITCAASALPTNPAGVNNARCGSGTVTLMASSSGAVIDWYSAASGGTPLLSGNNTYTTSSISTSTTYYAQARNSTTGCLSASRTAVLATVNTLPANPTGVNNARCGSGTVTISASSSGAVIDWYSVASGGSPLLSGNNAYTTPSISTSTTYYAQARNSTTGCLSASRTAVLVVVVSTPATPSLSRSVASTCAGTAITFTASGGSSYNWSCSSFTCSGSGSTQTTSTSAGDYTAQVRAATTSSGVTCYSAYTNSLTATITAPASSGQSTNSCGCASGLKDCSGTCQNTCNAVWLAACNTTRGYDYTLALGAHSQYPVGLARCAQINVPSECGALGYPYYGSGEDMGGYAFACGCCNPR